LSSVQSPHCAQDIFSEVHLSLLHIFLSIIRTEECFAYENVCGRFQINGVILEQFKAFLEITHESVGSRTRPQEDPRQSIVFPYYELQRYSAKNGAKVHSLTHRLLSWYFSAKICLLKDISGSEKENFFLLLGHFLVVLRRLLFITTIYLIRGRDNSDVTGGRISIPDGARDFFFSPQRSDPLWGPPSLVSNV
jgi:hypothetical protein